MAYSLTDRVMEVFVWGTFAFYAVARLWTAYARRKETPDTLKAKQPWWLACCFVFIGLGLDWRCAFEWFAGQSSFYTTPVLGRAGLIVLACAGVALLLLCVTRELRWRYAPTLFCLVFCVVYNILSVHWITCRAAPYNC